MPDRYGEEPAIDLPDAEWSAAQRRNAINACDRCDDDGLADGFQCDHQDHAAETEHGRALVQAALDAIRRRKADRARGVQ
jgi:hypothetical protein